MKDDLKTFICRINADYFVSNLLGARSCYSFDARKTFALLRKHIKEEMGLPFYKYIEFQKEMREVLNAFQRECEEEGEAYFVDNFNRRFIDKLSFYNLEGGSSWARKSVESDFKDLSNEPWHFIQNKLSYEYEFLCKLHSKIKKAIKSKNTKLNGELQIF